MYIYFYILLYEYSKMKILVLKFLKKVKFWCLFNWKKKKRKGRLCVYRGIFWRYFQYGLWGGALYWWIMGRKNLPWTKGLRESKAMSSSPWWWNGRNFAVEEIFRFAYFLPGSRRRRGFRWTLCIIIIIGAADPVTHFDKGRIQIRSKHPDSKSKLFFQYLFYFLITVIYVLQN